MILFPTGGLGRLLFILIIISTISYLVLNLVSFSGNRWVQYVDVPVRIGLWRVCDTTTAGLCNSWSNPFVSSITDILFNSSKPGFIRSSQALEIISLIFYVIGALFILIGIVNLRIFPYEKSFLVSIVLLFLSIIFLSATLGLMSVQGRMNRPMAFLDWAWWNGLVGLIMTIVTWISLISFIIYMRNSTSSPYSATNDPTKLSRRTQKRERFPNNPPMMNQNVMSPLYSPNPMMNYNPHLYSGINPSMGYEQQYPSMNYPNEDMLMSYPMDQYYYQPNSSPLITELARQYVNDGYDQQYQSQMMQSYGQFYPDPYTINSYF